MEYEKDRTAVIQVEECILKFSSHPSWRSVKIHPQVSWYLPSIARSLSDVQAMDPGWGCIDSAGRWWHRCRRWPGRAAPLSVESVSYGGTLAAVPPSHIHYPAAGHRHSGHALLLSYVSATGASHIQVTFSLSG